MVLQILSLAFLRRHRVLCGCGLRERQRLEPSLTTPPRCGLLCKFFQDAKPKRRRKTAMDANPAPISPRMFGSGIGLAVRERLLNSTLSTGDTVLGFRNPSAPAKNSIPSLSTRNRNSIRILKSNIFCQEARSGSYNR